MAAFCPGSGESFLAALHLGFLHPLPHQLQAMGFRMNLRQCLREPIPEIEIAAHRISDAVSAHLRGERDVAEELLRLADDKVVWDWLDSVWGKKTVYNQPRRILDVPSTVPKDQRAKPRDGTVEIKRLIHQRDGHYCRFCKILVVQGRVRAAIRKEYSKAVPWEGTNITQHAGFCNCSPWYG